MAIDWLLERMSRWKDDPAIVWRDTSYSYAEMLERIDFWRGQLDSAGVGPGQVVTLEGDYSPNACGLLLTLVERAAVAVPLTRTSAAHREEFMGIAEAQVVITFDDSDGWKIDRRDVVVTNSLTKRLIERGEPGLVVFSSGSTGKNKAILHDFSALLRKFEKQRHRLCTLTFLLMDHLGGINTLLYALSNGGTVVTVQSRNPEDVCRAIERHHIQLLPSSPTFLNILLISEAYRGHDLSSLELITYGTEVMPESTLKRLHGVFPGIRLLQTYGLSEVGVLRSVSKGSDSLWVKVGGEDFETKVVDGILWIRAKSAMLGYLNAPSPFDGEGWLNTEDEVEVDGDYIRILGRKTEIINVGGQKVYPAEVESVLMGMDNIRDATVYGEKNPIMGYIVAVKVNLREPEDLGSLKKRLRAYCKGRLAPYKTPVRVLISDRDEFSARYKKMRRFPGGG